MLTAEYGGTGGRPIKSGMVVEEPDIEWARVFPLKPSVGVLPPTRVVFNRPVVNPPLSASVAVVVVAAARNATAPVVPKRSFE